MMCAPWVNDNDSKSQQIPDEQNHSILHLFTTEEKTVQYFIQQGKNQKSFKRRYKNMILKVWEDNGSTAI